jgi:hypothetical protein
MDLEIVIPRLQAWRIFDLVLVFVMGLVIMVPRVARLDLMFAIVNRRRHDQERPLVPTGTFSPDAWRHYATLSSTSLTFLQRSLSPNIRLVAT